MSDSLIAKAGVAHAWPAGFGATLASGHWQVLHAKPRQEKRLIADLRAAGIPGVMFFERRIRVYAKSTQAFEVPLLGGYLFAACPRERREDLYRTDRVVRILDVTDPQALTAELLALSALLAAAPPTLVVRPELVPGRLIRISRGALAGCSGVVATRKGIAELVVNLQLLGQSVAVRMPADQAELADPS